MTVSADASTTTVATTDTTAATTVETSATTAPTVDSADTTAETDTSPTGTAVPETANPGGESRSEHVAALDSTDPDSTAPEAETSGDTDATDGSIVDPTDQPDHDGEPDSIEPTEADGEADTDSGEEPANAAESDGDDNAEPFQLENLDNPKEFDPGSLRGRSIQEILAAIPQEWGSKESKSGNGTVRTDPNRLGRQIRLMPGYTDGNRPDPLTHGPYAEVSQNGKTTKVALLGNPTLKGGS